MASEIRLFLERTNQQATERKAKSEQDLHECNKKIETIAQKLQEFAHEIKDRIRTVMEDVEKNVTLALNDEIKRIYSLIDMYERPFHPEEHQLNWYKKELHQFVGEKLGSNLSGRLNAALFENLDLTKQHIKSIFVFFSCYMSEFMKLIKFIELLRSRLRTSRIRRKSKNDVEYYTEI